MKVAEMTPFSDRLIYPSEPSIQTGKCDNLTVSSPSAVECSYNGSVHRPKHAGLHEPVNPDRKHRSDFPRDCRVRSRCGPDPVHPRNCRAGVQHLRSHHLDDRRPDAQCIQIDVEGENKHVKRIYNRSTHARSHQPLNIDREYRADISGHSSLSGGGCTNPLHSGDRRTCVLDIRGHNFNGRRVNALGLQVTQKNKPVGGFGRLNGLPAHILVLAILFSALIIPFVSATDVIVSFNPVGLDPDNLQIYNSDGSLFGIYNTSSTGITLVNGSSYSILVVPANDNLLGNHPDTWFQSFTTKVTTNAIPILILGFLIAMLIASRRR